MWRVSHGRNLISFELGGLNRSAPGLLFEEILSFLSPSFFPRGAGPGRSLEKGERIFFRVLLNWGKVLLAMADVVDLMLMAAAREPYQLAVVVRHPP